MELIQSHTPTCLFALGYCILARRAKYTWKQNACILSLGLIYGKFLEGIYSIESPFWRNVLLVVFFGALARLYLLLGQRRRNDTKRNASDKCSLGVFMGSGGHTAEMKALVSSLDFNRYTPRTYVYCHGDELSLRIVSELETSPSSIHKLLALPRARKVGEGRISTLLSATMTLFAAVWTTFLVPMYKQPMRPWVDVLLLNGPGTAVVLVAVAWIRRIIGLPHTKIIYVESFARTNSLSLSGKILRGFVDVFVVQWPEAAGPEATTSLNDRNSPASDRDNKVVYRGWLV